MVKPEHVCVRIILEGQCLLVKRTIRVFWNILDNLEGRVAASLVDVEDLSGIRWYKWVGRITYSACLNEPVQHAQQCGPRVHTGRRNKPFDVDLGNKGIPKCGQRLFEVLLQLLVFSAIHGPLVPSANEIIEQNTVVLGLDIRQGRHGHIEPIRLEER